MGELMEGWQEMEAKKKLALVIDCACTEQTQNAYYNLRLLRMYHWTLSLENRSVDLPQTAEEDLLIETSCNLM